jgi:hypothetical protein
MPPLATVTRILADISGARVDIRATRRAGQSLVRPESRMIVAMARAMRAISEADGACLEADLRDIGFTPPEIETFGAAAARVACKPGFDAIETDKVLEAA